MAKCTVLENTISKWRIQKNTDAAQPTNVQMQFQKEKDTQINK